MKPGVTIALWVVFTVIAAAIGSSKGRTGQGVVLGLLLGLIGVIIIACLSNKKAQSGVVYGGQGSFQQGYQQFPQQGYPQQGYQQPGYPQQQQAAGAWHPDPYQRHQMRYWDGAKWTNNVSDNGGQSIDPQG